MKLRKRFVSHLNNYYHHKSLSGSSVISSLYLLLYLIILLFTPGCWSLIFCCCFGRSKYKLFVFSFFSLVLYCSYSMLCPIVILRTTVCFVDCCIMIKRIWTVKVLIECVQYCTWPRSPCIKLSRFHPKRHFCKKLADWKTYFLASIQYCY